MADLNDTTEAVVDTIEHVIRLHEKVSALQAAVRDSLEVAGSLAGHLGSNMDYGTFYELAHRLQEADVPGRGVFTGGNYVPPPPGTIIRRARGDQHPPWPSTAPCVYLLLNGTTVIYVGKSGNVGSRMAAHAAKPWTMAEVIVCESAAAAAELEGDLIFQHQPELNRAGRWERPPTSPGVGFVDHEPVSPNVDTFKEEWNRWLFDGLPAPLPADSSLDKSIASWLFSGNINLAELLDLIPVALDRTGIAVEDRYRYFCGVAWRHIKERR